MAWQNWDLVVIVGGVDISAQLVDVAPISVEAERSAARIAEFTVLLSGTVDPNDWTGKTVTIDYVDGATTRVFNGVVSDPVLNIADFTLKCTCTDDLQRIVDGKTNAELLTLTGGYWSKYVFNEDAVGWERLQDILSTVSKSVELSTAGVLECHSLQNKLLPDYLFDSNDILDESLKVNLVKRSNLINLVNMTISARFERLFHRNQPLSWAFSQTVCDAINKQLVLPTRQMVSDAITGTNWKILSITYTDSWAPGAYECGGFPAVYNNVTPELFIIGFEAQCAYRWKQSNIDLYSFTISAPQSILAYGELSQSMQTAIDMMNITDDWGGSDTDFSQLPVTAVYDGNGNLYSDDFDSTGFVNAFNCIVAIAIERINSSHRSNSVAFTIALNPTISLEHTVKVDDGNLQAKGIVNRIRHTFELSSAKAVSEVELLLSSGQSGLDTVVQSWTSPEHTGPSGGGGPATIAVPTYVGGDFGSLEEDPTWWGFFVNADFFFGEIPDPPTPTYSQRFEIKFDAFPDAWTQNQTNSVTPTNVIIDVPHNLLTITA